MTILLKYFAKLLVLGVMIHLIPIQKNVQRAELYPEIVEGSITVYE